MIRKITLALTLFGATALAESKEPAKTPVTLDMDKDRLVKIVGAVDGSILPKATELLKLSEKSTAPIYILINSPGGSVRTGNVFIDAMHIAKARGAEIRCVSPVYAASMAFTILMNCSKRYALANTSLLFHPVRVVLGQTPITAPLALELARDLDVYDTKLKAELLENLGIEEAIMIKAYYEEKWWDARELQTAVKPGWITIVDNITGTTDVFEVSSETGERLEDEYFTHEVKEHGNTTAN